MWFVSQLRGMVKRRIGRISYLKSQISNLVQADNKSASPPSFFSIKTLKLCGMLLTYASINNIEYAGFLIKTDQDCPEFSGNMGTAITCQEVSMRFSQTINTVVLLLCGITLLASTAMAGTPYGKGVSLQEYTAISMIYDDPATHVGKTVKVEGLIVDVCSTRGCWMSIASDRAFETLRIKVDDGEIVFPITARGKRASVQGKVQEISMTKEQAIDYKKHQAEESGKPFDPVSVTGPVNFYQIRATGAVIE